MLALNQTHESHLDPRVWLPGDTVTGLSAAPLGTGANDRTAWATAPDNGPMNGEIRQTSAGRRAVKPFPVHSPESSQACAKRAVVERMVASSAEARLADAGAGQVRGALRSAAPFIALFVLLGGAGWTAPASAYPKTISVARQSPADAAIPSIPSGMDTPLQAPNLRIGQDGRTLALVGDLIEGIADQVASILASHPRIERLTLTSEGGLVDEGLALGALVAAHTLATYVPETCASACTLTFVRGRGRFLAAGARLGFHGPYETGFFGDVREVDPGPERRAYLNAGLTPDFVARALAIHADRMWFPDVVQLRAAGVVTAVVEQNRFGKSGPQAVAATVPARTTAPDFAFEIRSPKMVADRNARAASGLRNPGGTSRDDVTPSGRAR